MQNKFATRFCRRVNGTFADRCAAIRELLRPHELRHIVPQAMQHARGHRTFTEGVACYIRNLGIRYVKDPPRDHWCAPSVTLQYRQGDCDDFSILAASLYEATGVKSAVVLGRAPGGYHAWVAGEDPQYGHFMMEPQNGTVWWHGQGPAHYRAEFLLSTRGCVDLRAR